jgi:hypothetical protein
MDRLNPVVLVFGFFVTLFSGVGVWSFLSALLTRRSDTHAKDTSALTALEKESREFRDEVRRDKQVLQEESRRDKQELRQEINAMKEVFIPLIDTLDELLPKMVDSLSLEERMLLRTMVNAAKMKT